MPERPFASVVVPAHNEEARIGACVESLLALDYSRERYEVIVVENGSTDGTARVLERYGNRVRLLRHPRPSRAEARNAGLEAARGDLVAFVDGDCVADPGWLRAMLEPLEGRDRVVVAGDVLVPPEAGWVERFADRVHDQRAAVGFNPPYASTASCAMATAPLRAAGGFDPRFQLGSDVDLSYRLHEQGWSFVHQPAAVVFHPGEKSLGDLFRLGVRHGRQSILPTVRHAALLRRTGQARRRRRLFADVARGLANLARAPSRTALCELVFVTGKATGKLTGAMRLRRLAA